MAGFSSAIRAFELKRLLPNWYFGRMTSNICFLSFSLWREHKEARDKAHATQNICSVLRANKTTSVATIWRNFTNSFPSVMSACQLKALIACGWRQKDTQRSQSYCRMKPDLTTLQHKQTLSTQLMFQLHGSLWATPCLLQGHKEGK